MTTADAWSETPATALLVLSDGTVIEGQGLGATGQAVGEICFNTAMTGYQEILTDPSYSGQIITFTFPHIGNVGANDEDIETVQPGVVAVCAAACSRPTSPTRPTTAPQNTWTPG
jgi:carbamoyl-phosphate synthase small subunit